ncbi:geranylgeranyl pyrophosphate synthase isoform X1 [Orussus abietinus]|uniref:geranylgeranyl pyrophosphate synthase isoform X1 n=1 Tax=Orussus abietinus TaxID=222816 RepID=UPI0006252BFF|nr:geranylgeranyl pyrophosphate synthase isoform X1 [Orussus abietinus]
MDSVKNGVPYSKSGDKEQDEILLQPFTYILQVPGKQIRTKLAHAFNYWLKIPDDKLHAVGDITQMLHNSSLLEWKAVEKMPYFIAGCQSCNQFIKVEFLNEFDAPPNVKQAIVDDIQDNSILRRGIPVAHSIYGVASTINAANYVLFISLERVISLNHPEATQVYTEQLLELHRGQGMEIYWRDNYICPSESEYRQMTTRKTGGLFNLAVRLMQLFSDCKEDFSQLAGILGLYFQIRDDYCNLSLQEYSEHKSYCEDLSEGKFSFPIIHAIWSHPEDRQIMNILRQRTKDVDVKGYCVNLLEKFGSFSYTRKVLKELDKKARDEVERLGGNPLLMDVLDELLAWKKTKDIETQPSSRPLPSCRHERMD